MWPKGNAVLVGMNQDSFDFLSNSSFKYFLFKYFFIKYIGNLDSFYSCTE